MSQLVSAAVMALVAVTGVLQAVKVSSEMLVLKKSSNNASNNLIVLSAIAKAKAMICSDKSLATTYSYLGAKDNKFVLNVEAPNNSETFDSVFSGETNYDHREIAVRFENLQSDTWRSNQFKVSVGSTKINAQIECEEVLISELESIEDLGSSTIDNRNHLINGSFEYPKISRGWGLFSSEEQDPAQFGWTVKFTDPRPCPKQSNTQGLLEIQRFGSKVQWAELDSHCRSGWGNTSIEIYQDIILAEGEYVLSLDYKDRTEGKHLSEGLAVEFAGTMLNIKPSGNKWRSYTAKVELKSKKSVRVKLTDIGRSNTLGALVDNVRISKIEK